MWLRSPASTFRRRLRQRERSAYLIKEDLNLQAELTSNLRLAQKAVALGKDDEAVYERLFKQQAPDSLRRILNAELLLWLSVRDALGSLSQRDMLPDGYRQEAQTLKPRVNDLLTLTTMARALFTRQLRPSEEYELESVLRRREER